ncbi:pancreatic lipase-related protein 2-like [Oppia nitens]|uniref:pancreatic lipase-related protein 2-like n=1 Tax=Oppia nitens TaxID=1686743 RepID=UPI0023DA548A|nr:pancreatic lipase-related protein 2-like [Oppia nitens]
MKLIIIVTIILLIYFQYCIGWKPFSLNTKKNVNNNDNNDNTDTDVDDVHLKSALTPTTTTKTLKKRLLIGKPPPFKVLNKKQLTEIHNKNDEKDRVLRSDDDVEDNEEEVGTEESQTKPTAGLKGFLGKLVNKKKEESQNNKVFIDLEENMSKTEKLMARFKRLQDDKNKSCYGELGCFRASDFNESARTLPLVPMPLSAIDPKFHLYTAEHRTIPRNYSYNASSYTLKYSSFNPNFRTAIITHGFQSGYSLWLEFMKDFIFFKSNDTFNVVVVIWEKGAKTAYNLAATNTRLVGACIAHFVGRLRETFNVTNDRFWLIGHSLGAHTMGYAGKKIHDPKVYRITGLDPAGVGFHFKNGALRLHNSDAQLVDVIHTDGSISFTDGFGTNETLGHYDFYPNGGNLQPGCAPSFGLIKKLSTITEGNDITCSHSFAYNLLNNIDKPDDMCSAVAYQCENFETFIEGRCASCDDNKCQPMGLNMDYWLTNSIIDEQTIGKLYFVTTAAKIDGIDVEYCMYHYQFGIHISKDSDSSTGVLVFRINSTITNADGGGDYIQALKVHRIMTSTVQNRVHTFLLTTSFRITKIHSISVEWRRYNGHWANGNGRFNRGFKLKIPVIEINYMSSIDKSVRDDSSTIMCPQTGPQTQIIANKPQIPYTQCSPELSTESRKLYSRDMIPFTYREDLWAIDYLNLYPVYPKIKSSMFSDIKFKKLQSYLKKELTEP